MFRIVTVSVFQVLVIASLYASTINEVISEVHITNWSNDTDSDPRALAALSNNRFLYFEDEPGAGQAEDAVVLVDGNVSGDGRFTVLVSELTLRNLAPQKVYGAHVSDIAVDHQEHIYLMVCGIWKSKSIYDNYVVKVPRLETGYGEPELVCDLFDGGQDSYGRVCHRLAIHGNTLFVLYTNGNNINNGVYRFDLSSGLVGSSVELLASYEEIAQVTGSVETGLWQIIPDSMGNLFAVVFEGAAGDLIRINGSNGEVTVVATQSQLANQTGISAQFTTKTNMTINRENNHFYLFETGTTNQTRENIYEFDQHAQFVGIVADATQIIDALSLVPNSFTTLTSNSLVYRNNKLYSFLSGDDQEILFEVDMQGNCIDGTQMNYLWPTQDGQQVDVASAYGPRQLASGNYRYDWHRGIDITMAIGTPVYAVAEGEVIHAGVHPNFSDPVTIIRHGACAPYTYSHYMHLSDTSMINAGDLVSQGDVVGLSGASASGYAHLHFEIRLQSLYQSGCVNPLSYLPYTDQQPEAPRLVGCQVAEQTTLVYEFHAHDHELDVNGFQLEWGNDRLDWDWNQYNQNNGPSNPEALDNPVIDFGNGIQAVVFPSHTNASSTQADYLIAFRGLDQETVGSAKVLDLQGTGLENQTTTTLFDLSLQTQEQVTANIGETVSLVYMVTNHGTAVQNLNVDVRCAVNHSSLQLDASNLQLAPGQSSQITVTLEMSSNAGDAVLFSVDSGMDQKLSALTTIQAN